MDYAPYSPLQRLLLRDTLKRLAVARQVREAPGLALFLNVDGRPLLAFHARLLLRIPSINSARLAAEDLHAGGSYSGRGIVLGEFLELPLHRRHLKLVCAEHRVDQNSLLLLLVEISEGRILLVGLAIEIFRLRKLFAPKQLKNCVGYFGLIQLRQ